MRTPVMHRERAEELAHLFHDEMREQGWDAIPWADQPPDVREALTVAFDRLITSAGHRIGEVMIKTCGRCGGSGQIPAVMTYRDCPDCDGTGQVDTGSDDD